MFLGEVDRLAGESIQTKFFVLGVPLIPLESFYSLEDDGNGVKGFEIGMQGHSVLAGYLRLGTFGVAMLAGIFGYIEHSSFDPQYGMFALSAIATAAWVWVTFWWGRLSKGEKTRRSLLKIATGVGAPPRLLPDHVRASVVDDLQDRWARVDGVSPDWRRAIDDPATDAADLLLLHALAEYAEDESRAARARARLLG